MMYLLLAVPVAAAMYTMVLGAYTHRDYPDEAIVWASLLWAPAIAFGWGVVGFMMLEPVGIEALWIYAAPFLLAFAAVAIALIRMLVKGIKVFQAIMASLLVLASLHVAYVMLSGVFYRA